MAQLFIMFTAVFDIENALSLQVVQDQSDRVMTDGVCGKYQ